MAVTSAPATPSCRGIDGLTAGSVLDFHLNQGPRPPSGGGCYAYETLDLTGTTDVTLVQNPAGYLLPYWMARYYGFIAASD